MPLMSISPDSSSSTTSAAMTPPSSQVSAAAGRTARAIRTSASAAGLCTRHLRQGGRYIPRGPPLQAEGSAVGAAGRSRRNRLPRAGALSTVRSPPWATATLRAIARPRPAPSAPAFAAAEEPLEDAGQLLRVDARAIVPDGETDEAGARDLLNAHLDPAARLGELHRIGDEVRQRELHPLPVARERERRSGPPDLERDALAFRRRRVRRGRRGGEVARVVRARCAGPRCPRRAARGPAGSPRSSAACPAGRGRPRGTPGAPPRRRRPGPAAAP